MLQFASRQKSLEEIPADDSTSKTIQYLRTNGTVVDDAHFEHPKQSNGVHRNGHVEFNNGRKAQQDKDLLHPSSAAHKPTGNTGYKTRLRSRKSQAGVN